MSAVTYIASATRRNVRGKPNSPWVYEYTNGTPVAFDDLNAANYALSGFCENFSNGLQDPRVIEVEHVFPPIPSTEYDYSATFEGYEPGDPLGRGATIKAAVQDLLAKLDKLRSNT